MSVSLTGLAAGALGFTAALAWNDAVSKTVQSLFPPKDSRASARIAIASAVVITLLVVLVAAIIDRGRRISHARKGEPPAAPESACAPRLVTFWEPTRTRWGPSGPQMSLAPQA